MVRLSILCAVLLCGAMIATNAEAGNGCGVGVAVGGFRSVGFVGASVVFAQPVVAVNAGFRKSVSVQKVRRNGTFVNVQKVR